MEKPARKATHQRPQDWILSDHLESMTDALAAWVLNVTTVPPPEPCLALNYCDIPVAEWRRALDEWCRSAFVRRAFGYQATEGLRMALGDFDDPALVEFLQSLV